MWMKGINKNTADLSRVFVFFYPPLTGTSSALTRDKIAVLFMYGLLSKTFP